MPTRGILDGDVPSARIAEALTRAGYDARVNYGNPDGSGQVIWHEKADGGLRNLTVSTPDPSHGADPGAHTELDTGGKGEAREMVRALVAEFGGLSLLEPPEPAEGDPETLNALMDGGCYAFALFLHERTGLPLFGLADWRGIPHHAGVLDLDGSLFVDARGEVPASRARYFEGRPGYGHRVVALDRDEVARLAAIAAGRRSPPGSEEMEAYAVGVAALRERMAASPSAASVP